MGKIKLLYVEKLDNTIRLQSQLMVGKDSVDFILEDNVLKNWCYKNGAVGFHKTDIPYKIVTDKKELIKQKL